MPKGVREKIGSALTKDHYPRWAVLWVGLVLVIALGTVDYYTGHDLALSSLYVLPIGLVAWYGGPYFGGYMAMVSAATWILADVLDSEYQMTAFLGANAAIRLALFFLIVFVLSALHKAMRHLEEVSRYDSLTGAINSSFFYECLDAELERLGRYGRPLTLVYLDLDGFKLVNDESGHLVGDKVLRIVAESARSRLRKTDVVARMGGDEFAFLCPETDEEAAHSVVDEVIERMQEEMRAGGWAVSFSVGVVTCHEAPDDSEELVKMADDLMYSVKLATKDGVKYASLGCSSSASDLCDEQTLLDAIRS